MGYCGPMGYGMQFPANQVGGQLRLWGIRGYGLSEVWVMRGSAILLPNGRWPNLLANKEATNSGTDKGNLSL
ncbi:hypothetical protein L208DRAFT_1321045 [Tricholoma matsutake]|nr:hypothetical protein L208DRAFT_1321045 [Tricholoma matsutake 945]